MGAYSLILNTCAIRKAPVKLEELPGILLEVTVTIFAIFNDFIMRNIADLPGIIVGGHMINNLRYADDIVLIANSQENLQILLNIVITESDNVGLTLNVKKTESMVITKCCLAPTCEINIDQSTLKRVNVFKYLGTMITENGRNEKEIRSRITQSKQAYSLN